MLVDGGSDHIRDRARYYIQKHLFLVILVTNIVLYCAFETAFVSNYDSGDDEAMASIANGSYGENYSHLVFINILIGKGLVFLYGLAPTIPWYGLIQTIAVLISFTVIFYVIISRHRTALSVAVCLLLALSFFYSLFIEMQFTKTAGILAVAGSMVIVDNICMDDWRSRSLIVCGVLLVVLGSLYRWNAALLCCGVCGGLALGLISDQVKSLPDYSVNKSLFARFFPIILRYGAVTLVAIICVVGCLAIDKYVYDQNDEWRQYREYNVVRSELQDYGLPDYYDNEEAYLNLDVSYNDYACYKSWKLLDPSIMTADQMRGIIDIREGSDEFDLSVKGFFKSLYQTFFSLRAAPVYLALIAIWLLFSRKNKKAVLFSLIIALLVCVYLYYVGRYTQERVSMLPWFAASALAAYCVDSSAMLKQGDARYACSAVLLFAMALNMSTLSSGLYYRQAFLAKNEKANSTIEAISEDEGHLYLMNDTACTLTTDRQILEEPANDEFSNIYYFAGWPSFLPFKQEIADSYEMANPFRDIVNNEKAYVIDPGNEFIAFIQEHYDENAELVLEEKVGGYKIYSVQSEEGVIAGELGNGDS